MSQHSHNHHHPLQPTQCDHGCCHDSEDPGKSSAEVNHRALLTESPSSGRRFLVSGLDCVEEVRILKDAIGPMVGGADHLAFNVVRGELILLPTASAISDEQIIKRISETGMQARVLDHSSNRNNTDSPLSGDSRCKTVAVATSGLLFLIAFLLEIGITRHFDVLWGTDVPLHGLTRALLLLAIIASTSTVAAKIWYSLRNLRLDMNALMFVAILGALGLNEWTEAATVAFLFALSLQLEAWSVHRARRAIDQLLHDDVSSVRILDEKGTEQVVSAESVSIGTTFIVRPGERLSLDGRVVSGRGEINESLVTGESFPVFKKIGDTVFAGTINGPATLTIESTSRSDDTQLSRIVRLVSEHQARKGTYETWVEQFARWYTPAVLLVAIATIAVRALLLNEDLGDAFYNGLALLVIACPCALVISTPVSVVAALSSAARSGILVKGGRALEMVGKVTSIVFDKTGTLTLGTPEVIDTAPFGKHTQAELLTRLMAIAGGSEHPLSKAIVRYAQDQNISASPAANFQAVAGQGASGDWNGKTYRIGSLDYHLNFHTLSSEEHKLLEKWKQQGFSVVVLSSDEHLCGAVALRDQVRPEAATVLADLKKRGIASTVLLSGDHPEAVAEVARQIGLSDYSGGMLPEEKVERVYQLRKSGKLVAMVGDGINDAPALAAADLGIAMGAGTDVALETADIALIHNDLNSVVWLMDHSARMLSIIRQNIFIAIGIKIFFAVLALVGSATLWGAIAADLGASLLVIFNGLRLLRK